MQNTTAQSPPFGYLSPPIDGCDASSEDGDTLQTPLTDHIEHHQPYTVYHQQHLQLAHIYSSDSPSVQQRGTSPKSEQQHQAFAPFRTLLTPHASERLAASTVDNYFADFSSPPRALDLENASLEYNPFAASFASAFESANLFAPDAPPYSADRADFEFLSQQLQYPEAGSITNDHALDASGNHLSPLSALSLSSDPFESHLSRLEQSDPLPSLLLDPACSSASSIRPGGIRSPATEGTIPIKARLFNPRFPAEHNLNPFFARSYLLGDELGAGGYGFVMTARHRLEGHEVAVKFIIKEKVPEHAWWDDELLGRVPTEIMIMSLVNHENIVRCLDLFEDELYFYLVQELHGTPWISRKKKTEKQVTAPGKLLVPSPSMSTPSLTPSPSADLVESLLVTPPQISVENMDVNDPNTCLMDDSQAPFSETQEHFTKNLAYATDDPALISLASSSMQTSPPTSEAPTLLEPSQDTNARPNFSRRPSYDLFECIEQSKHKRLSENDARYIFAQVIEAVYYLDNQGITHCDIKDENLVVDADFKVKLIDFGSAVVAEPNAPRPFYTLFFGTTAYASSEILRKRPYQAPPAEIWTLGVLLSYLLTGHSPFQTEQDAIDGRVVIRDKGSRLSRAALSLLARCLEREPERRADIAEVRGHRWLQGALDTDRECEYDDRA